MQEQYTGVLIATAGDGWRCKYQLDVEANSPAEAWTLVRNAWQEQSTRPGMHIREIRLWRDGQPVPYTEQY